VRVALLLTMAFVLSFGCGGKVGQQKAESGAGAGLWIGWADVGGRGWDHVDGWCSVQRGQCCGRCRI
jgi:hypothetical protein